MGAKKCNDCGHVEAVAKISQKGDGSGDLIGALVAVGIVAIGAALVGSFVNSLSDTNPYRRELPIYDEENWRRYFR